jgi:hypothetical protein
VKSGADLLHRAVGNAELPAAILAKTHKGRPDVAEADSLCLARRPGLLQRIQRIRLAPGKHPKISISRLGKTVLFLEIPAIIDPVERFSFNSYARSTRSSS